MARTPNPPVKGHALRNEGMVWWWHRGDGVERPTGGKCQCGAAHPDWPHSSAYANKQWHRLHKAELRGGA